MSPFDPKMGPVEGRQGFSLVAILVGLAIIGIAMSVLMVSIRNTTAELQKISASSAGDALQGAVRGKLLNELNSFVADVVRLPVPTASADIPSLQSRLGTVAFSSGDLQFSLVMNASGLPAIASTPQAVTHVEARARCINGPSISVTATYIAACFRIVFIPPGDDPETRGIREDLPVFVEVYYGLQRVAAQSPVAFNAHAAETDLGGRMIYTIYWQDQGSEGLIHQSHSGQRHVVLR